MKKLKIITVVSVLLINVSMVSAQWQWNEYETYLSFVIPDGSHANEFFEGYITFEDELKLDIVSNENWVVAEMNKADLIGPIASNGGITKSNPSDSKAEKTLGKKLKNELITLCNKLVVQKKVQTEQPQDLLKSNKLVHKDGTEIIVVIKIGLNQTEGGYIPVIKDIYFDYL